MSPAALDNPAYDRNGDVPMDTSADAAPADAESYPDPNPLTMLRSMPEAPQQCQVCVVGAGPAGLMAAANLARFGVKVQVIDDRADPTPVGR